MILVEFLIVMPIIFIEILGAVVIGLLLHGLTYQLTGIRIYKVLNKILFKEGK